MLWLSCYTHTFPSGHLFASSTSCNDMRRHVTLARRTDNGWTSRVSTERWGQNKRTRWGDETKKIRRQRTD